MIAQVVTKTRLVYNPVNDVTETKKLWYVLVCSDNFEKEYDVHITSDRYTAEKLCTKLNHAFHPEWFEH